MVVVVVVVTAVVLVAAAAAVMCVCTRARVCVGSCLRTRRQENTCLWKLFRVIWSDGCPFPWNDLAVDCISGRWVKNRTVAGDHRDHYTQKRKHYFPIVEFGSGFRGGQN